MVDVFRYFYKIKNCTLYLPFAYGSEQLKKSIE